MEDLTVVGQRGEKMEDFIIVGQRGEEPINYHVKGHYYCVHTREDIVIPAKKSALIETGVVFSYNDDKVTVIQLEDDNFKDVLEITDISEWVRLGGLARICCTVYNKGDKDVTVKPCHHMFSATFVYCTPKDLDGWGSGVYRVIDFTDSGAINFTKNSG